MRGKGGGERGEGVRGGGGGSTHLRCPASKSPLRGCYTIRSAVFHRPLAIWPCQYLDTIITRPRTTFVPAFLAQNLALPLTSILMRPHWRLECCRGLLSFSSLSFSCRERTDYSAEVSCRLRLSWRRSALLWSLVCFPVNWFSCSPTQRHTTHTRMEHPR